MNKMVNYPSLPGTEEFPGKQDFSVQKPEASWENQGDWLP